MLGGAVDDVFLRQEGEPDDLAPQPTMRQLDVLVGQMREAGLPVDVEIEGDQLPLPPSVDLSAYRILQEALTNTLKHAGPAKATVTLRYDKDTVHLEVADDGRGLAPNVGNTSRGSGLLGMRERVGLHGGALEAGPRPEGGFVVRASLPLKGGIR